MSEPTTDDLARWERLADVHTQCATITGFLPQCRCGSMWPCATGEALDGLLALVAAQAGQIAELRGAVDVAETQANNHAEDAILLERAVKRVRALCDEAERLGGGSASDYDKGAQRLAQRIVAALDGEATP